MQSSTVSVDATPWLLLLLAIVVVVSLSIGRYGRCPLCGGPRVLRMGRHGAFRGCSNYPRCHAGATPSGGRFPLVTRGRGPLPPLPRRRGDGLLPQVIGVVLLVLVLLLLSHR